MRIEGAVTLTEVLAFSVVPMIDFHVDVVSSDARQQIPRILALDVCPHHVPSGPQFALSVAPFARSFLHCFHERQAIAVFVTGDVTCNLKILQLYGLLRLL